DVWDSQAKRPIRQWRHGAAVPSITFSPDGKLVLTGSMDYTARVWDMTSPNEAIATVQPAPHVYAGAFACDSQTFVTGDMHANALIWTIGPPVREIGRIPHPVSLFGTAFSPDGKKILTGSADAMARLWDRETGALETVFQHRGVIRPVAFSNDGKTIL